MDPNNSTIIINAYILTMDEHLNAYPNGYVKITDGLIEAVGQDFQGSPEQYENLLDAKGGIVIPGMINCHTHAAMSLFRGLGDDEPDRLYRYIYPLEKEYVTPEFVRLGSELSCAEMLLSGTTFFADMYFFEEEVAMAAEQMGIRVLAGQTVMNRPLPDADHFEDGIKRAEEFCRGWKDSSLVEPCIAPHAPYSLERNQLIQIMEFSKEHQTDVQMHVAESEREEKFISQLGETSSVSYLNSLNLLNERLLASHCIRINEADIQLLEEHDCRVSHNPVANTKGAHGTCPLYELLEQKIIVGLGTDGPMSGNNLDLFRQMAVAAPLQKNLKGDRALIDSKQILSLATLRGAEAKGKGGSTGSIETGKWADLVVFDSESVRHTPLHDPYSTVVYSLQASDVKDVFVSGKQVVENGILVNSDLNQITNKAREFISKWPSL